MSNPGFYIENSNSNCITWGKDGTLNVRGSIFKITRGGVLSGYGYIDVAIYREDWGATITIANRAPDGFYEAVISEEEAMLVINALKSEAGELTAADFYPGRVKEILDRVWQSGQEWAQH